MAEANTALTCPYPLRSLDRYGRRKPGFLLLGAERRRTTRFGFAGQQLGEHEGDCLHNFTRAVKEQEWERNWPFGRAAASYLDGAC